MKRQPTAWLAMTFLFSFLVATTFGAEPRWTWVKGNTPPNFMGIYGTQGVAAAANKPGARTDAATWTDKSGRLWLFGGSGSDAQSRGGYLSDLWRFDSATGNWTWVKGSNQVNQPAVYGTQGQAAPANTPGARASAATCIDASGRLWLFGGYRSGTSSNYSSDLWCFDPATGNWTWVKGSNLPGQYGIYGTQGVSDAANRPGARLNAACWIDAAGRFWLFGGDGSDYNNNYGNLNDLWCFDPATGNWTWVKGSDQIDQPGVYAMRGTATPANTPGARYDSMSWTGKDGRLWLCGGVYYDGWVYSFNDLWFFDPATNNWTWVKGASYYNPSGVYGTLGVAASDNTPGGRGSGVTWIDASGRLWLFGGYDTRLMSTRRYSDLWCFDPATGNWTWIKGSNQNDQPGVYGTQGVAAPANAPGARNSAAAWRDATGKLWLYGGYGLGVSQRATLNDLWQFDPATGNWTWVKGNYQAYPPGVYGTPGLPAAANIPGVRYSAYGWTDANGNLWLFGGVGYDRAGNQGYLNDLWRFDPALSKWAWIKGSDTNGQAGVYGTQGQGAPANTPGARYAAASWRGKDGRFWLFGGAVPGTLISNPMNDLWSFDPATNYWTWVKGSSAPSRGGVYGTQGMEDPANTPGARSGAATWIDAAGRLWLFGGEGLPGGGGTLSDLWRFDPATGNWTWIKGSSGLNEGSIYGTPRIADAANTPGARSNAVTWTDPQGRFWLFGGDSAQYLGTNSHFNFNDLWCFDPATNEWMWFSGDSVPWQYGSYGIQGVPGSANTPGAREWACGWADALGRLWLFGGSGWGGPNQWGYFNDLWRFDPTPGNWTWVRGSKTLNQQAYYGTAGIPASANTPGARRNACTWIGKDGRLWLFGGTESGRYTNDLWALEKPQNAVEAGAWLKLE